MRRLSQLLALLALVGPFGCDAGDLFDFDEDGSPDTADCEPADPTVYPGAPDAYGDGIDTSCDLCGDGSAGDGQDEDCDGFPANEELRDDPSGVYDCNDNDPSIHPGAVDVPNDGADQDCFEGDCVDEDGDGHCAGVDDCDDADDSTWLGAPEQANCVDHDCDGLVSEGTRAVDDDGDGACEGVDLLDGLQCCAPEQAPGDCDDGDPTANLWDLDGDGLDSCGPDGVAGSGDEDCDDGDDDRKPGLPEICDGKDDDCDGVVPEDELDLDGDGFLPCAGDCDDGDPSMVPLDGDLDGYTPCQGDCDDADGALGPADHDADGFSTCTGDCNDFDPTRHPGAPELCDGLDQDCDGLPGPAEVDGDGDGWLACFDCDDADPAVFGDDEDNDGYSACVDDCNDGNGAINPLATDLVGDAVDQNCDGVDGTDADGDGAASALSGGPDCDDADPALNRLDADGDGVDSCSGDCDDADPAVLPGAPDAFGDGLDADCDGTDGTDADGDGFAAEATGGPDCDDADPAVHPGAPDPGPDGVDSNCDGVDGEDADGDGFAATADGGADCDDGDPTVHPGAIDPLGDGIDADCDGVDGTDADGDGFVALASGGEDCDDADPSIFPHATEVPLDGTDQNCDGLDVCGDLNCDNWTDVVFGNNYDGSTYVLDSWIYLGSATGWSAANRVALPTQGAGDLRIADLDGDGYLDIAATNQQDDSSFVVDSWIYYGGPAGYSAADRVALPTKQGAGLEVADLDADGWLDLVISNYWDGANEQINSQIWWGSPTGYSALDRTDLPTSGSWDNAVDDLDRDGFLDVVFGNFRAGANPNVNSWIYWGDASGGYSTANRANLPTTGVYGVATGDLDGDLYPEVVFTTWTTNFATYAGYATIHWNSPGGFTGVTTVLTCEGATGISLVDLDADGDRDLFCDSQRHANGAYAGTSSWIYWNEGGTFSEASRQELVMNGATVNFVGDVTGDGTPDLLAGNWFDGTTYSLQSWIWPGDSGSYSAADRIGLPTLGGAGVAAAGPGIPALRSTP